MRWEKIEMPLPIGDFVMQLKLKSKKICLIRDQGTVYAMQPYCPHAGGVLAGGWCKDKRIVCPIHRYEYDLTTGKGSAGQGDYIDIYTVEERKDGLYIGYKESWWKKIF